VPGVVKRLAILISLAAAALALPGTASAARDAGRAGQCGIPTATPVWIDFATESMIELWGQRGIVAGASTGEFPAKLRARGATTIYWDMNFNRRVGTPNAPADPGVIVERANRLFDFAAAQSGCAKPLIALNELFGAHLPTPWSATNDRYRANVLVFLRTLAARGARPFLLISSTPYTGGEAADWWREAARHADLVPEVYFSARAIYNAGAIVGNRTMRRAFRRAIARLVAIGIPSAKTGLVLGFQTAPGAGGREGLRPAQAWFETVKWQVLAARQVSRELRIGSVWSWGWATYSARAVDPDKSAAACVYLWTRAPAFCNGPRAAGAGWNDSRKDGQIVLPPTQKCAIGGRPITAAAVAALNRVTGDRDVGLSILLARLVESDQVKSVSAQKVLAAERAVVLARFRGSRSAYVAALRGAGASVSLARGVLADELRRLKIEAGLRARRPSAGQVSAFYSAYPDLLARRVEAKPAPWWLGGRPSGLALEGLAPPQVFTLAAGRKVQLRGVDGPYSLRALGEPQPLGSIPLAEARPTISSALAAFERRAAFERWTVGRQEYVLRFAICTRDEMPTPGTIRLTGYLPFLSLTGV
jgi:hypothetical protein